MNCAKVKKLLPLIAGGEIAPSRRREAQRHLARCSACSRSLAEYEALLQLAHGAPPVGISEETGATLVRDIIDRSRGATAGGPVSHYLDTPRHGFRIGYRLAGAAAVIAVALIAAFIAFGTHLRGGPTVEEYLLHSDLTGLCNAIQDDGARQRLLDESVSIDLLIQTVETLQRNRIFHSRIENRISESIRELKIETAPKSGAGPPERSHATSALLTCAKTDGESIRLENMIRALRCLRRSGERVTVREILRGLEVVKET